MSWPLTLLIALLCALAGGFAYNQLGYAFIQWHRIGNAYGYDSYYSALILLGGAFASAALGAASARWLASSVPAALAFGLGASAVVFAAAYGLAYATGDHPPTLDGDTMIIETELMIPPVKLTTRLKKGSASYVSFRSLNAAGGYRSGEIGGFDFPNARTENGRLILPASVFLFTATGSRQLSFQLDDAQVAEFIVPLRAHPSREHLQWSPWSKNTDPAQPRFRFRIARKPVPIEAPEVQLPVLTPESPLSDWVLAWQLQELMEFDERQKLIPNLQSRLADFAPLLETKDLGALNTTLQALHVCSLEDPPPNLEPALRAAGATIAAEFQSRIEALDPDDPDFETLAPSKMAVYAFAYAWEAFTRHKSAEPPPRAPQVA